MAKKVLTRESQLIRFEPFSGNSCESQVNFIQILEISVLSCEKTVMETQLLLLSVLDFSSVILVESPDTEKYTKNSL